MIDKSESYEISLIGNLVCQGNELMVDGKPFMEWLTGYFYVARGLKDEIDLGKVRVTLEFFNIIVCDHCSVPAVLKGDNA